MTISYKALEAFYKRKRVFVTGHTGFKGAWLTRILRRFGSEVMGYSLEPPTNPSLFEVADIKRDAINVISDIGDYDKLSRVFKKFNPEIVFHLAAQPIVLEGYRDPIETYRVNVMGTANVLECLRYAPNAKSFLNVTTDKVYENHEWCWGYRETDNLNGYDPYSNSKSCSELVTHCFARSFFTDSEVSISTARAGNVVGGGDFAANRIVPDCIRAASCGDVIEVRNPYSTRPYQHVLEPLSAYLCIAMLQYGNKRFEGSYNIGPNDEDCISTGKLADLFCASWGDGVEWESHEVKASPHEAGRLKLDCSKIRSEIGWKPTWDIETCIDMTCQLSKVIQADGDVRDEMNSQIEKYFQDFAVSN